MGVDWVNLKHVKQLNNTAKCWVCGAQRLFNIMVVGMEIEEMISIFLETAYRFPTAPEVKI